MLVLIWINLCRLNKKLLNKPFRFFHLVGRTNYPIWVSIQVLALTTSLILFLKYGVLRCLLLRALSVICTAGLWFSTVALEGLAGNHTFHIQEGLRFSFGLFLLREVIFFFGIFWAYLDSALSAPVDVGGQWPPKGILPINPIGIPLFNTVVLLRRGASSTWAHRCLLSNKNSLPGIYVTLLLAFAFETAQYVEFRDATFSISDGIYGRVFFFGTGFHGLHVIFGHGFMFVNTLRLYWNHFSPLRHLGLELGLLYWHFVDLVWLFLYLTFYWWGF